MSDLWAEALGELVRKEKQELILEFLKDLKTEHRDDIKKKWEGKID